MWWLSSVETDNCGDDDIQTKGGESRDMSKRDLYKKPFLITVSKLRRQKWETKPKKRDNVEVGGIESSREMLWNKQKARLNGGVPIFEKGADVLLLPKSRVRHHHQFKRPARQMTALESSPHQRTRITVEAFGQAGEPLGTQCWKVCEKCNSNEHWLLSRM